MKPFSLWLMLLLVVLGPHPARAASVSFSTAFPRSDGGQRSVSFAGDLTGKAITGQLTVDGQVLSVNATLATDALSGRFEAAGREVGSFSAKVVGRELQGSHDLNGVRGAWSIPLSELPSQVRGSLK